MKLKNINEQTIVMTGATSGIGLTTVRMAAEKGAKLVLIARNEDALRELADELNRSGAQAIYHAADVADEAALREAARMAVERFGGIDTWVNNAGGSVYGRIMDVPTSDLRQIFETNVWGVVNGSRIAVEYLKASGGALINIGSEVSDAPVPLQGMYSASKHAVKGFTDALRMELEADKLPISVTLIKPTAIHTPFPENAKNYLPYEPQLPQPMYAPELVAEAILHCAETPTRDFFVGGMAKAHSAMALNTPRVYEKFNETVIDSMQNSGEPARDNRPDGLYDTNSNLRERGAADRFVRERSLYQQTKIHPLAFGALAVGSVVALGAILNSRGKVKEPEIEKYIGEDTRKHLQANQGIREKMEVVGADGAHVGTVDGVVGDQIKLTRKDSADGQHHFVSTKLIESVEGNQVRLRQTADEVRQSFQSAGSLAAKA